MLTAAQQITIHHFKAMARENGSHLDINQETAVLDPTVIHTHLTETASAEWDREVTIWYLRPDGVAEIL